MPSTEEGGHLRLAGIAVIAAALACALPPAGASAKTIKVDTNSGALAEDGACSLPEAIIAANTDDRVEHCRAGHGADVIKFDIAGSAVIQPAEQLPDVTKPATIDGTSEPDFAGDPVVVIDQAVGSTGIEISSEHVTIKALAITDFTFEGIRVNEEHNKILGCYLGVDPAGTAHPNGTGVALFAGHNRVGDSSAAASNVISGNGPGGGVVATGEGDRIEGNIIGLDPSGSSTRANASNGVSSSGDGTRVLHNTISGNADAGIRLGGTGGVVKGNVIGLSGDGSVARANENGVEISGKRATIGGRRAVDRNVISGNSADGIAISTMGHAGRNLVIGNYIGTDATGDDDAGNASDGIQIQASSKNAIGGNEPREANVISGNFVGVRIGGLGVTKKNVISGNLFGTNPAGEGDLGNQSGAVRFFAGAQNNVVGGLDQGDGNLMKNTPGGEVSLGGGNTDFFNSILGNSAFAHGEEVIDLAENGVTPNDLGSPPDTDDGPNHLQNFPFLIGGDELDDRIFGNLDSTPNASFRIEFFTSPDSGDAKRFVGAKTITTNGGGHREFTFASAKNLPVGQFVTATATLLDGKKPTDTSELSDAADISVAP